MAAKTALKTQIVGLKEFRANITSFWKKAKKDNIRYLVLHHSTPVFEVNPINKEDIYLESFLNGLERAEGQARRGELYTHEEVMRKLGL